MIRTKCLDCSAGVESEIRKCTAIGCALWPYRMATNPFRAPREVTPEQREAGQPAWPLQGRVVGRPQKGRFPSPSMEIIKAETSERTRPLSGCPTRRKVFPRPQNDQTHPHLEPSARLDDLLRASPLSVKH